MSASARVRAADGTLLRSRAGAAFGLAIDSRLPCPGLSTPGETHRDRAVTITLVDRDAIASELDRSDWIPVGEDRLDDGTLTSQLHRHPEIGYRFVGQHFGEHLIRRDGREIRCAAADVDPYLLERFVIGKLLPLAAVVQGLEIFHASAVVVDDRVLAFAGASGTGKSSVATQHILAGARFFADDVLSIARKGDNIEVYPGPDVLHVRRRELDRLDSDQRAGLGVVLREDVERASFLTDRDPRGLPLGGLYVLDRSQAWVELSFTAPPDFRHLLACTYDIVTQEPARLANLLTICALLERLDRVRVVRVPPGLSATAVAAAIREHSLGS
jgi:hypothetical protein